MFTQKLKQMMAAASLFFFCSLASSTSYTNTASLAPGSCCLSATGNSIGQTFETGAGTLTNWSFFVGYWIEPAPVSGNVKLVVAAWDGSKAVGPAFYTSQEVAYLYDPSKGPNFLTELAFSDINTSLSAGAYIAYLTTVGVSSPADGLSVGLAYQNGGLNGYMHSSNSMGVDPLTLSTAWRAHPGFPPLSMLYSATIVAAPVPEPAIAAMLLTGMGLLAALVRRKKQQHPTS
jgi:PEP-CTERM motif